MEYYCGKRCRINIRQQYFISRNIQTKRICFEGGKDGLKIVIGLIPLFLTAAFFESFVTRYTEMPIAVSLFILLGSLVFLVWYFIIYPIKLHKRMEEVKNKETSETENKNFNAWLSKKFSSEK